MKRGIEAGDLRQARPQRRDRPHRCEAMRLVYGCQRRQCVQRGQDRLGHLHGGCVVPAAMRHAVSDRDQPVLAEVVIDPPGQFTELTRERRRRPTFFDQGDAVGVPRDKMRRRADPLHLSL